MFIMLLSCSFISRMVNIPCSTLFIISFALSGLDICKSFVISINPCTSPIPNILDTKELGENRSRSCRCSPVPMNIIGVFVAATLTAPFQSISPCPERCTSNQKAGDPRRDSTTSLRVTVHLCDDDGTKPGRLLESLALSFCSLTCTQTQSLFSPCSATMIRPKQPCIESGLGLTDACIQNHDRKVRFHLGIDLLHLLEQLALLPMSTGCVDNNDFEAFLLELLDTRGGDRYRIRFGVAVYGRI
jgi:hypothetical protein